MGALIKLEEKVVKDVLVYGKYSVKPDFVDVLSKMYKFNGGLGELEADMIEVQYSNEKDNTVVNVLNGGTVVMRTVIDWELNVAMEDGIEYSGLVERAIEEHIQEECDVDGAGASYNWDSLDEMDYDDEDFDDSDLDDFEEEDEDDNEWWDESESEEDADDETEEYWDEADENDWWD